jgi:hypothetical protein
VARVMRVALSALDTIGFDGSYVLLQVVSSVNKRWQQADSHDYLPSCDLSAGRGLALYHSFFCALKSR